MCVQNVIFNAWYKICLIIIKIYVSLKEKTKQEFSHEMVL